jgi:hypothetical protein
MMGPSAQNPLHPVITTRTSWSSPRVLSSFSSRSRTLKLPQETQAVPAQINIWERNPLAAILTLLPDDYTEPGRKIRNSNIEIRNKFKFSKLQTSALFRTFGFYPWLFRNSSFGFRISFTAIHQSIGNHGSPMKG